MADDKKYYYMRLKEDFFDSDAIQILESMQDGYLYSNILLKLYLKSLKFDGRLMYNDRIPYNATVLATITRHSVGVVEKALDIFEQLGLIEILDNGAIYMMDIQLFIGKSSTESDRKREYRSRINNEKRLLESINNGQMSGQMSVEMSGQMSGQMSDKHPPEIRDKRLEIRDKRLDIKDIQQNIDYQLIADLYNDTCVSFPRLKTLSDNRKKAIKARLKIYTVEDFKELFRKAEASDFLKGSNDRNWSATFDWLIKADNMAKVLEGNYDNKTEKPKNKFNNFPQRSYDYDAIERMAQKRENPPKTVADDQELKERAARLKEQLTSV